MFLLTVGKVLLVVEMSGTPCWGISYSGLGYLNRVSLAKEWIYFEGELLLGCLRMASGVACEKLIHNNFIIDYLSSKLPIIHPSGTKVNRYACVHERQSAPACCLSLEY